MIRWSHCARTAIYAFTLVRMATASMSIWLTRWTAGLSERRIFDVSRWPCAGSSAQPRTGGHGTFQPLRLAEEVPERRLRRGRVSLEVGEQARNAARRPVLCTYMESIHPIVKPWHARSTPFALLLLAAIVLPYSAPGICLVLGRMGMDVYEMGMMADAGSTVLQSDSSSMECCSMDGCGVPHAGPAASFVEMAPGFQRRMVALVTEPSDPPPEYLSLLERPPRA